MPDSQVYVAGVGVTPWSWPRSSLSFLKTQSASRQLALSAGTKALLDAGLCYDNVDCAVACGDLRGDSEVFYLFGKTGIPIHEADNDSSLYTAFRSVDSGDAHCILMVGLDEHAAVGLVLTSGPMLWRHPYLKDSSARIRGCAIRTPAKSSPNLQFVVREALSRAKVDAADIHTVESNAQSALDDLDVPRNAPVSHSRTSLHGICQIVWRLRGWTHDDSSAQNCLQCTIAPNGAATATVLSRADGNAAPTYEEAKHKNDGRERLGYNPAVEQKAMALEDWEAIKSRPEFSDERVADKVPFRRKGGDRAALAKL